MILKTQKASENKGAGVEFALESHDLGMRNAIDIQHSLRMNISFFDGLLHDVLPNHIYDS